MRRLLVLSLFLSVFIPSNTLIVNAGFSNIFNFDNENSSGLSVYNYFYDIDKKNKKILPIIGWMLVANNIYGSAGYESYTETMGTVNVFNDREDGILKNSDAIGIAAIGRILIKNQEFIFNYGFIYDKSYYVQALYDSSEILGNNGKYYIDSNEPEEEEYGIIAGIKYNFHIPYISTNYLGYGIGIGMNFSSLSNYPKFSPSIDLMFYFYAPKNNPNY
tara:strand:- start:806 stop:1459 length:654 start_codon:yes stop_codon:yes gene_type:complete